MPRPAVDLPDSKSRTVSPVREHHAPESGNDSAYPDEIVALAELGHFEEVRDRAVSELTSLLEVDSEDITPIEVSEERLGGPGGAHYEGNELTVDTDPDLSTEPEWVEAEHLQAEGIYEEVNHILAEEIFELERGRERKDRQKWTYWDNSANEILGSLYKWGEDWSFQRPFEKANRRLEDIGTELKSTVKHASDLYNNDIISFQEYLDIHGYADNRIANDIFHFIGYKISEEASDSHDPAEIARMDYGELREEFSQEIDHAEEELRKNYGIKADLDREIGHEEGFEYFVKVSDGEYMSRGELEDFPDADRQFFTWEEDEIPERAR